MKILIVGSQAAAAANLKTMIDGKHAIRKPQDLDIIGSYDDIVEFVKTHVGRPKSWIPANRGKNIVITLNAPTMVCGHTVSVIDAEVAWSGSSGAAIVEHEFNRAAKGAQIIYAFAETSYWLKMSHRFLRNSPHFEKTRTDILAYRDQLRIDHAKMGPSWYAQRVEETYWYTHPKLNVTKEEFFSDDGIKYVYDHDSIHEAVALGDKPAYKYYTVESVRSSRKLFEALPFSIRLAGVIEESFVLALERSQIPFGGKATCPTPAESYKMALQKVCSSITSGWFRSFAWDNYDRALAAGLAIPYVDMFNAALNKGLVKPYTGKRY